MGPLILGYGLEFLIQAVFLFIALWIMIKVQHLNFNYRGLILTAVISTVVSMVADHWLGDFISTGMVCSVLVFCVWKVTRADQVDVIFTVAVGTAMVFAMNLFLLGWMMGDLRPSAVEDEEPMAQLEEIVPAEEEEDAPSPVVTNVPPRKISESTTKLGKELKLKGVVENGANSSAIINSGQKNHTLRVGESFSVPTADGAVKVRCESVTSAEVILDIAGEKLTLKP